MGPDDGLLTSSWVEEAADLAQDFSRTGKILHRVWIGSKQRKLRKLLDGIMEMWEVDAAGADEKLEEALRDPVKAAHLEDLLDSAFGTQSPTALKAMAYLYAGFYKNLEPDDVQLMWQSISGLQERDIDLCLWLHDLAFKQNNVDPRRWSPMYRDFRCELTRDWLMDESGGEDELGSWILSRGEFTHRLSKLVNRGLLLPDGRPEAQEERVSWGFVIDHNTLDYWRVLLEASNRRRAEEKALKS